MKTTDTGLAEFNIVQILWRRRTALATGVALGALLVFFTYKRAERVYEAKATVGIGKTILGEDKLRFADLESPDVMAARFLARYRKTGDGAWLSEAKADKLPDISSLTLTTRGRTPEEATALLKSIVQSILVSHEERYQGLLAKLKARYDQNQTRFNQVRGDFDKSIAGTVAQLKAGDLGKSLAEALRPWSISNLSTIEEKQSAIETAMASGVVRPTELFGEVAATPGAVEPRPKAYLGGGAVLVALFAFFTALLAELASRFQVPVTGKKSLKEALVDE